MLPRLCLLLVLALPLPAAIPSWQTSPRASVLINGGATMSGDHFAPSVLPAIRGHFAGCRTVALVLHATPPDDRDRMEVRLQEAFRDAGVPEARSLHRMDEAGAKRWLETADAIFVGGGETFVLLRDLAATGQLDLIRRRVLAGAPYFGVSAGSNVAGPVIGTTNDFPVAEIPSRHALALLPVSINPHHPLPEEKGEFATRANKIRWYLRFNPDERVLALGNASMVRLHEGVLRPVAGRAWLYDRKGPRELPLGEPVPELSVPGAVAPAAVAAPKS